MGVVEGAEADAQKIVCLGSLERPAISRQISGVARQGKTVRDPITAHMFSYVVDVGRSRSACAWCTQRRHTVAEERRRCRDPAFSRAQQS